MNDPLNRAVSMALTLDNEMNLRKLRSSCPEVFYKNFVKYAGKHLCQGLFLIKLQA